MRAQSTDEFVVILHNGWHLLAHGGEVNLNLPYTIQVRALNIKLSDIQHLIFNGKELIYANHSAS